MVLPIQTGWLNSHVPAHMHTPVNPALINALQGSFPDSVPKFEIRLLNEAIPISARSITALLKMLKDKAKSKIS